MPMVDAFRMADQVLYQGVDGITSLITTPGLINLDFADVKSVMAGAGSALMGIGIGSGADRATEAAKAAISSPLLESSIDGAKGVLLSIAGPTDLTLHEVNAAADAITRVAHPDANIIFGAVVDDALGEEVRVTVVAAGFDKVALSADNRFESRLSRLLEEPVRDGGRRAAALPAARRRRRRVRHGGRAEPGVGVLRRGGGPGHPGLPEELNDRLCPRGPARTVGAGRARRRRRPSPASRHRGPARPLPYARDVTAPLEQIAANVATIGARLGEAAVAAGRAPRDVRLVAVSKTVEAAAIRTAVEAGVTDLGENYVRELRDKRRTLEGLEVRWHFIGALQSGTAHHVADLADVVETVAGEHAARRLAGRATRAGRVLDVLIEVDFTGERAGVAPEAVAATASLLSSLEGSV